MRLQSFVWLLLPLMAMGACQKSEKPKTDSKQAPLTDFQEAAQLGELYPLATGGAYLPSLEKVFYISGDEAVVVKGLPSARFFPEIHPLSDGSAILNDQFSSPPALYLLRKDVATPISEKAQLSLKNNQEARSDTFYFLEAQRFKRKLKESKAELKHMPKIDASKC